MNYTNTTNKEQLYSSKLDTAIAETFGDNVVNNGYFIFQSGLKGFEQTSIDNTTIQQHYYHINGAEKIHCTSIRHIEGIQRQSNAICECGCTMHSIGTSDISLLHLPYGPAYTKIKIRRQRFKCPNPTCNKGTYMVPLEYKAENHMITVQLEQYARTLLALGLTLKEVSHITGINKNVVKDIDKQRLEELYTEQTPDGIKLKKPSRFSKYIGIDEFKLHDGYKYATVIADLETGQVLYLAIGKKKAVVNDFIEFVGIKWMEHVVAVGCDMNSDFEEEFRKQCPWLHIVFDYFHIVKNFNDKVVSEIRKDEQKRLMDEGNVEAARELKGSKYILTSSKPHLKKLDKEAKNDKESLKSDGLFKKPKVKSNYGYEKRYNELINSNKLLLICDIVKEMIHKAYSYHQEARMRNSIRDIIEICYSTNNKHFIWFGKLLDNHFEGIVSHAKYQISSGKIEGINNKIKTIRRQSYGLPDDDYFFLKIIDSSNQNN